MVSEERLDALEKTLKEKVEITTGFADEETQQRQMEKTFKYFDTNNSGVIDYDEFFAAMTRLNFVGVQRELEALFDRYDDDCNGTVDYNEFSKVIAGTSGRARLDTAARNIVDRVKARIVEIGGANGIRSITHILKRMDKDGSFSLDRRELIEGLQAYGMYDVDDSPGGDVDKLMMFFDRDHSGKISVEEFHRGIRSGMSRRRKLLVAEAFQVLDSTGDGIVTVADIQGSFNAKEHPAVMDGTMSEQEVFEDLLATWESGEVDGKVTWHEFLDYYKDISCAIEDDDYFELMIRNAWHLSGGEGAAANTSCRRVLVTHSDGSQEVCEIKNDLGLDADDIEGMKDRLLDQGVRDIADIDVYG